MNYSIKNINGHCEIYGEKGEFLLSADTESEAVKDIEELLCA